MTRAAFISGIMGRKSIPLPSVATQIPAGAQPESRGKRLPRWLDHARLVEEGYLLPSAEFLWMPVAWETLGLVMERSVVGRGCVALRLHIL